MDFASLALIVPPLLGQGTAIFLFLSPLREIKNQRHMGAVKTDSVPFVVTFVQHFLWMTYAGLLEDMWVFFPNFVGIAFTTFYITSSLRYNIDQGKSRKMEWILSFGMSFAAIFLMFAMTPIFVSSRETRMDICGNICMGICIAMYATPCLEAVGALWSRDASKLSLPLAIAGALNGGLWTTYGLGIQVIPMIVPNAIGLGLSVFNILVKLTTSSSPRAEDSEPQRSKVSNLLLEMLHEERAVLSSLAAKIPSIRCFIHSLPHEKMLYVPPAEDGEDDLEKQANEVQVSATATGVAVEMLAMPGGCLAFRLEDGRFLQVRTRDAGAHWGKESSQPATYGIVAQRCVDAGEEGLFWAVPCGGLGLHKSETRMHSYDEDTTWAFWNPLHKVFLRVNEHADFDCSPNLKASVSGDEKLQIPTGWLWERFEVHIAQESDSKVVPGGYGEGHKQLLTPSSTSSAIDDLVALKEEPSTKQAL
jgi:hypothetical protein